VKKIAIEKIKIKSNIKKIEDEILKKLKIISNKK